jgi:predicted AlkP superfamily pyrophosphatase or phosphodiesterase
MVLNRALFRFLAPTLLAIAVAAPVAGSDAPAPTAGRRVVLVSFDGAGGLELQRRLAAGFFSADGFARAAREGEAASRLAIVTPSLTAVSHVALATGALPGATGIVGNTLHPAGTALKERRRGFDLDPDTETLWEAAARQGRRVASLGFPGASQKTPRTRTALALSYNEALPKGRLWKGPAASMPFVDAPRLPEGIRSFSPAKTFVLDGIPFALLDATDDGATNYDTLVALAGDGSVRARARAGEWFPLSERRDEGGEHGVLFGRWSKLVAIAPDLSSLTLYLGDGFRTWAAPEDFRRAIEDKAGFWPGPPDTSLLRRADPDLTSFLEQARRFSRFFVDAFDVADQREDWDLLLAYNPILDECEHDLLVTDPAQPFYTKELAAKAAAALNEAWRAADEAAARYLRFREKGDVFLVSDHGMRAMVRSIFPAAVLARMGLLKVAPGPRSRPETAADSPVDFVAAGGGTGFVVVNRVSLPGGVVRDEEAGALVSKAAAALRDTKDEKGARAFAIVATRSEAAALGLDHPNAGDLVVVAAGSGYLRGGFPAGGNVAAFGPPEVAGQHGFDPDPALDGIFLHVGDGISPARLEVVREIDVAARVAARLGIAPPRRMP